MIVSITASTSPALHNFRARAAREACDGELRDAVEAEAARIVGCAEGTIKSRVSRARVELARRIGEEKGTRTDLRLAA